MTTANPFSRLLSRLSVGRKLMLIYLLDLTAVIFVSSILINEKFIAIDFARKEIAGNAYIAEMRDGLIDAALWPAVGGSEGLSGRQVALARTEAEHGPGMQSEEPSAALAAAYGVLATAGPSERRKAQSDVLSRGRDLITRVGNQSNLILDPDLDSYYTMSLIVLRYPELLETIDGIGTQLAAQVTAGAGMAEARTQYLILEGKLDATRQGIDTDHSEAYAAGGPALKTQLRPAQERLQAALEAYRRSARLLIDSGATPQSLAGVHAAQAGLVHELQAAWAVAGGAMDGLLDARVASLYHRMWIHLGTALALLCAILAIVYFVARQIAMPLRHLAEVTDTVRLTGDHTRRAQWNSSDEIGRLVVGFNDMLAQLDQERETQKELAASARAADAQRALVEATPIPLVVTSVPGHEVLHANPPAEAWLAGHRSDPWKHGLDSSVRARFFQQLADRGAVDEFEVRWGAGAEPAWAVLSARRVRYQGQDAVLTAFAPINHLKLMERRLELWAKVFEASSEGILIVDAQRRILTANQAFSRHTGYELQEVVGEKPSLMLAVEQSDEQSAAFWQSVSQRGTWQGELQVRRRNGSEYPAWLVVNAVRQSQGDISHYIFTSIDISDRKKSEQRIRFLADHDVLTELPNRSLCTERLRLAVQQAQRSGQQVAVMFIDLDRFKDINDSLGHHIGDGLLRSVARRLLEAVRAGDTVSRLGGDEFVIVLNGVQHIDEVTHIVDQRLIPLIRRPHLVEGAELHVSCSVGIAIFPDDATDIDELMKHADTAMYQAKAGGKDAAEFFTAEMTQRAESRMQLDADLRRALELGQFELHWQPRVSAAAGVLLGVEGLLRWQHPQRGLVSPAHFIPLAEETGLIVPIGAWVIEQACRQVAAWRAQGLPSFGVSINLSARQLRDDGLTEQVRASMLRHGVPPGVLELELTESMVMDDAERNLRQMHTLRDLGVGLSIDDFGTGYSSLAYLNRFPIDKLKIDRSFVHDMLADPTDRAITMAIIGLGHALGLQVVAEGVEEPRAAALLREARCDELQGFLFGRPMPVTVFEAWLAEREAPVSRVSA
ncbi:EAL domain-containing protein [Methylibium sp.]|uniref:EAL domain-containing protein n=1 Tax=Methylibium sp. TaxID=2067992 RepID=UPI00333FB20F